MSINGSHVARQEYGQDCTVYDAARLLLHANALKLTQTIKIKTRSHRSDTLVARTMMELHLASQTLGETATLHAQSSNNIGPA
jgi:hypothetical protein